MALIDWSTGDEISLSILYLVPIVIAVWFAGRRAGIGVSLIATCVWFLLDAGADYSHPVIPYWNAGVRLGFFLLTTVLLDRIRFLTTNLENLVDERTAALETEALERNRAESTLRQMASIVQNANDAIIAEALDGTIESWNRGAERLYGYTAEEVRGRQITILIPQQCRSEKSAVMERLKSGEVPQDFQTIRRRKDGSLVDVLVTVSPICDEQNRMTGASIIARDFTERRRLEREIAEISQEEQQRLAHELHDQFGAQLAGAAFRAKALAETLEQRSLPEADNAKELVNLLNEGTNQVRNFARVLIPVDVASGGLASSLGRLGADIETLYGVTCLVDAPRDLGPLAFDQAQQLYRIAQEAARNAVQHGKAKVIEISIRLEHGILKLTVKNDGQAWKPETGKSQGMGLRIMRYRAGILGGSLNVQSGIRGTTVTCTVPQRSP